MHNVIAFYSSFPHKFNKKVNNISARKTKDKSHKTKVEGMRRRQKTKGARQKLRKEKVKE